MILPALLLPMALVTKFGWFINFRVQQILIWRKNVPVLVSWCSGNIQKDVYNSYLHLIFWFHVIFAQDHQSIFTCWIVKDMQKV